MTIRLPPPGGELTGEVQDEAGHVLPYVIRLATQPQAARTLVVLHGRGANERPSKFTRPDWNVLCPLDRYGEGRNGCWWLGEGGDFFVLRLLHQLIRSFREAVGKDRGLYFWGSSMGGYGAILHGTLLRARATYSHIPQIRLRGTRYTDGRNRPCYDAVLGDLKHHPYMDLARFVASRPRAGIPLFFLSQNRFDYPQYLEQHCLHFVAACQANGLAYGLRVDPVAGHVLHRRLAETVGLFDEFAGRIADWRRQGATPPAQDSTPSASKDVPSL